MGQDFQHGAENQISLLRIAIDGRNLGTAEGTGVATYATVLLQACQREGVRTDVVTATGTSTKVTRLLRAAQPTRRLYSCGSDLVSPDLFRVAQVHFNLYRRPLPLRLHGHALPAIMHWTYPLPLHLRGVPNVVTIHDLIPLRQPELTGIASVRMRRLLAAVIAQAAVVVTVSETVRHEVIAEFGTAPERVVNLSQAIDLPAALLRDARTVTPLCPPGSFLVFGTVERRKNIGRLIQAHAESGVTRPLVILGPDGDGAAAELAPATRHPLGRTAVQRIVWSNRPALIRAIAEAHAVLFPSLAEGFGLPILEAMALGTPVMTSRGGATEEIAGGAALLIDPLSVRDMANGIAALDREADLPHQLRAAGLQRGKVFSLDAYAKRLRTLYETVGSLTRVTV